MNMLPIAPNAIAKRMSDPNRKERRPTRSIIALPNPFVSFELVGILPTFRADVEMWACSLPSCNPAERGNQNPLWESAGKKQGEQLETFPCLYRITFTLAA